MGLTKMVTMVTVITASGLQFEVAPEFQSGVFAVIKSYRFFTDGMQPDREELGGYTCCYIPNGNAVAHFQKKLDARGFCMWLARHLPDYDPANVEHEAVRQRLMGDMIAVCYSYKGIMAKR
jgi:hypothetical protein